MAAAIEIEQLSFEYPTKRALRSVSVSIDHAAVVAMVGPNGAGKTTLLRCMAALEMPFSGAVRVLGVSSEEQPRKVHRLVGYLSDFFGLYDELTARRCLMHAGAMQGLPTPEVTKAIGRVAEDLELTKFLEQRTSTLSRGLRQRVAIAQAILHSPKVLLLDEPASGLDPEARTKLAGLIRRLAGQGMTIVVSSHILAELDDYCSHMLTVEDGRILGYTAIGAETSSDRRALRIDLAESSHTFPEVLSNVPGVTVSAASADSASIFFSGTMPEQAAMLRSLVERGLHVSVFAPESTSIQDIYLSQLENKRKNPEVK